MGCSRLVALDRVDRSELEREPTGRLDKGDLGLDVLEVLPMKDPVRKIPGLIGEVAIGEKNGSTIGLV